MLSLEEKLRPQGDPSWRRDLMALAPAVAASGLLLWNSQSSAAFAGDLVKLMFSFNVLLAMGLLAAFRRGALDLSVWAAAGMGGLVAAAVLQAGASFWAAFSLAALTGAGLGAVNALLVAGLRLPSPLVTPLTAAVVVWAAGSACQGRTVAIPDGSFAGWAILSKLPTPNGTAGKEAFGHPISTTRALLVAAAYGLVVLELIGRRGLGRRLAERLSNRWKLAGALLLSGGLSALGGALWLMDAGSAPVPTRIVDDLRPLAAAVLAGGLVLCGPGRSTLAALCLPPALLTADLWRQKVWDLQYYGYAFELLLLVAIALTSQAAARRLWRPGGGMSAAAAFAFSGLAMAALAAGATFGGQGHRVWHTGGLLAFLAGALLLAVSAARRLVAARAEKSGGLS